MCFFIYAMEELYSYYHHGSIRVFTSSFTNSKIVPISPIHRNRNGINSVKRAVLAISHHVNQEQVEAMEGPKPMRQQLFG